ncbi:uncharacterized protein F5147DRAFT_592018 [Suillus discolor]|uniref:Fungal-type protein kinase domain-containing protein n=1 Tax=Suillus discolor TaxID=1912936 RepID=A0A9P7ERA8_9AGAM|nr:uncharacterized protein F5147DRAFT_592018 [Suillus discolor]KAG2079815.1 hypothetical protein F5147DRAFT_592018 [Suillus discolor]
MAPFCTAIVFCNRYRDLRVHLYDRSGGLVSPVFNINNNPDMYLQILAGIVFGGPQCLGYDCTVVFYDPIGKIHVKEKFYNILHTLFYSRGLTGRGTVCYLVELGGEEFIIKDHWVQGQDDTDILNEVEMLKWMQGVPGVPHLEDYWIVEREKGVPDTTGDFRFRHIQSTSHAFRAHVRLVLKPCARPLHQF